MPKNKLKFAAYLLVTVILTLGLSISLQSLLAAWTAPTASPPGNNIDMPINESASDQTKLGGLSIRNNFYVGDGVSNDVLYVDNANGKVGIGTTNPGAKLDVDGDIKASGNFVGSQFCIGASCINSWPVGDITAVNAGTGITGGGITGSVTVNADTNYLQRRVSSSCAAGSSIRVINANGTVSCEIDDSGGGGGDITAVNAGTGITGGGITGSVTVNADTNYLQRRVSSSCAAGSSIRVINANGTVSCEIDDSGATLETDPYVDTVINGSWCKGNSSNHVQCTASAPADVCPCGTCWAMKTNPHCAVLCGNCCTYNEIEMCTPAGWRVTETEQYCPACPTTPYLFTYNNDQFLIENDIMNTFYQAEGMSVDDVKTAYETDRVGDKFENKDTYKLLVNPEIENNTIKLQIRELEPEESHIDQAQLVKVVHDKNSLAFADIPLSSGKDGEIHNGDNMTEINAQSCNDENNQDCLKAILKDDAKVIEKDKGGYIIVEFDVSKLNLNNENYLYFNAWGKEVTPRLLKSPIDDGYSGKCMMINYKKDGKWNPIGQYFNPRAMTRLHAVRATDYNKILPEYIDNGKIALKIDWTARHELDKISIVSFSSDSTFEQETLKLTKANSSREGNVLTNLLNKDFVYAHTVRGDVINLEFDAGQLEPNKDETVDYFFVSKGYYHGLRTYLYPDIDTSQKTFEQELNNYVEEFNNYVKTQARDLPYPKTAESQSTNPYLNSFNSYYSGR